MSIRILQLTDLHLYKQRDGALAGVPTWETFAAVQRQVRDHHADFDHLILTGDLAQDEDLETYQMMREALGDWLDRCRIIPGNHDDPLHIRAVFPELFDADSASLNFAFTSGGWQVIGLDSRVVGEITGRVGTAQLAWLQERLDAHPSAPALVFVHHPPLPIDVAWLDTLGMNGAEPLVALIADAPQVKLVCAGHVHQAWESRIGNARVCTTPSTCVQFGSRAEKSFDTKAAGYRTITLDTDGRFTTEVHRLADG